MSCPLTFFIASSSRQQILSGAVLLSSFTSFSYTVKAFRKEAWDVFLDHRFFETASSDKQILTVWRPIIHSMLCQEGRSFSDLLAKFSSGQGINVFSSRESEGLSRARLLQRISFAVFAAPMDHYLTHLTAIQERLGMCVFLKYLYTCPLT